MCLYAFRNKKPGTKKITDSYKSLWEIAYTAIRRKILTGEFPADTPIVVSKLSEEMGMSIIPIREAVRCLENEGLVNVVPHKGVVVTRYDIRDIEQIYDVRRILESRAMFLAVPNITPEAVSRLRGFIHGIEDALMADDFESYLTANNGFHQTLYGYSGNAWLCKMIDDLWFLTVRSVAAMKWSCEHRQRMIADHKKIIQLLEEHKSPEFMGDFIAQHVETAKRGVIQYVEEQSRGRNNMSG
jgi:DNA-binding GntR family transcriptional regulator